MNADTLRRVVGAALEGQTRTAGAAVLIPLVETDKGPSILLEVRALTLDAQPGELCLPGGHIETGEIPRTAAVRETCEELLVDSTQIEVIGSLGNLAGPGGRPLYVLAGLLSDYAGTYAPAEVDHTFTLPLNWLLNHEPIWYDVALVPHHPEDFPWELVPGGRDYPWHARHSHIPFYLETNPLVWGATARVLAEFARRLRNTGVHAL